MFTNTLNRERERISLTFFKRVKVNSIIYQLDRRLWISNKKNGFQEQIPNSFSRPLTCVYVDVCMCVCANRMFIYRDTYTNIYSILYSVYEFTVFTIVCVCVCKIHTKKVFVQFIQCKNQNISKWIEQIAQFNKKNNIDKTTINIVYDDDDDEYVYNRTMINMIIMEILEKLCFIITIFKVELLLLLFIKSN